MRLQPLLVCLLLAGCSRPFAAPAELSPPAAALRTHVEVLVGLDPPRTAEHPASLELAAEHIAGALRAAGARVEFQELSVDDRTYRNVSASLGPAGGPRLVVGAHYDAVSGTPGADDNASGVAVLLELAKVLEDATLEHTVELVAYTLEEPPYFDTPEMGSMHHARALREDDVELLGMIGLEMVGYFREDPGSQEFPLDALEARYGDVGDFLAVVGREADAALVTRTRAAMSVVDGLELESLLAPRWLTGMDFSDHASYWSHDYTALMLTDTAFYRNPNYHERSDTVDTLDYERMALIVEAVAAAVQELAGASD